MKFIYNPFTGNFDSEWSLGVLDSRYVNVTGDTMTGGLTIEPDTDTLTALVVNDTDSNNVLTVDTINNRVGIGTTAPNSKLHLSGSFSASIETVTASSDTLDETNHIVLCDCTSNAITVNLPTAVGIDGRVYHVKKVDSTGNTVTIDGSSAQTIDGDLTQIIDTQYDSIMIVSDGSNWLIL